MNVHRDFANGAAPPAADPDAAALGIQRLTETAARSGDDALAERIRGQLQQPGALAALNAIFGASPFLTQCVMSDPAFAAFLLANGPDAAWDESLSGLPEAGGAVSRDRLVQALRVVRRRVALTVAAADLCGLWPVERVAAQLSRFADLAIQHAARFLVRSAMQAGRLAPSPGLIDGADPFVGCGFTVLALGKLGAEELNYSSDIDIVLLVDTDVASALGDRTAQEEYVRIARDLVGLLQERTKDGYVFRVDLRLRPDPSSTPPCLSRNAAITYYESFGQNWERAAMIRARPAAGDFVVGRGFIEDLTPFIWRKNLDFAAIQDIHAIKRQIHAHRGGSRIAAPGHNIKLGRGGIREIEFFAQTQQLIWGGRDVTLRGRGTTSTIETLAAAGHCAGQIAREMSESYWFLRSVEHRLQMIEDQQTQTLPTSDPDLERIAALSGFSDANAFVEAITGHLSRVADHYARLFEAAPSLGAGDGDAIGNLVFTGTTDDPETLETLAALGFKQAPRICESVRGWHRGRIRAARSERARQILTELMPDLLTALSNRTDPDAAFGRFDSFIGKLPSGVQLFSLFKANPRLLDLVAEIMGSAPLLAERLSAHPHLLDNVLFQGFKDALPSLPVLEAELERALSRARDRQDMLDIVRRWANDRRFQVGVQILQGALSGQAAGPVLADIAETVIVKMLSRVIDRFAVGERHGWIAGASVAVIAVGRLGSREMTVTSDIDLVFVYDAPRGPDNEERLLVESDGERPLPVSSYFQRLTQRTITALTVKTGEGALYEVDLRLRPSGNAGPIAVSLDGFRKYHAESAWTWEHMALTRARVIAGPAPLCGALECEIHKILTKPRDRTGLVCDVAEMRDRIGGEHERKSPWDMKFGEGGQVDLEFVAQFLQLASAASAPTVLAETTGGALAGLAQAGCLPRRCAQTLIDAAILFQNIQSMVRLTIGEDFPGDAPPQGVEGGLRHAGGAVDLPTLRQKISDARTAVSDAYRTFVADPASAALAAKRATPTLRANDNMESMTMPLDANDNAPDFTMPTDGDGTVSLSALRGKTVILYFYPKDDTTGCTKEACGFRDMLPDFSRAGAEVIGVSKDSTAKHDKFKAKYDLPFTLASDAEGSVCDAYGVWVEKSMYGKKYMGIDRATFLIDGGGVIRKAWRKVKVPGHVEQVLKAAQAL